MITGLISAKEMIIALEIRFIVSKIACMLETRRLSAAEFHRVKNALSRQYPQLGQILCRTVLHDRACGWIVENEARRSEWRPESRVRRSFPSSRYIRGVSSSGRWDMRGWHRDGMRLWVAHARSAWTTESVLRPRHWRCPGWCGLRPGCTRASIRSRQEVGQGKAERCAPRNLP
jgi:hypothetical protein